LKSARTDAENLALLRTQCVQFLYGAVRNALAHIHQNRLNRLEQIKARDLSASNSRRCQGTNSRQSASSTRRRCCTIARSQGTFTTVHLSSSLSISDHLLPPTIIVFHWHSLRAAGSTVFPFLFRIA
jgi:hypothetical protein